MPLRTGAAAFAVAAVLAGCGDDETGDDKSDKQQAEAIGLEFWERVNRGDRDGACKVSRPKFQTGNACSRVINLENLRGKLDKPGERKVSVRGGDEAIVTIRYEYGLAEVYLLKEGGRWKVAEFNAYEGR